MKEFLDREASRINNPAFIADDPVQFPRRFTDVRDIEITALISAIIAWGNRKMICRDAEKILNLMDNTPYDYVIDKGYEDLDPNLNLHRTFFGRHFQWLLRGLRKIYSTYPSLDAFCASLGVGNDEAPAWAFTDGLLRTAMEENKGISCPQCFSSNLKTSALKRINMALRWLVRDDGIVDMGVWESIPKSKLYIPLDVHVGNTARNLGLLTRKSNDRKAVNQLTETLRKFRPDDPVIYDYALFGIGIESKQKS
ncbi:MAG: TIGR02757 family protein [Muribaculaceae bacterium]|nr:TIGR02757 family protein [Muribaculaceae bacterium]